MFKWNAWEGDRGHSGRKEVIFLKEGNNEGNNEGNMTKQKKMDYWLKSSENDWNVAGHLLEK